MPSPSASRRRLLSLGIWSRAKGAVSAWHANRNRAVLDERAVRRGRCRLAHVGRRRSPPPTVNRPVAAKRRAILAGRKSLLCGCYVQRRGQFRAVSHWSKQMAAGTENGRSDHDIDFDRLGLVERFCVRFLAQRFGQGDDHSVIDEVPRPGPDQTSRIVRSGAEQKIRWAAIVGLAGLAAWGWFQLCGGIDAAQAKRALTPQVMPAIERHAPPMDTSGCLVLSRPVIVTRYK